MNISQSDIPQPNDHFKSKFSDVSPLPQSAH